MKTNIRVSLFRANLEKCFVSGLGFSRAEKGQEDDGLKSLRGNERKEAAVTSTPRSNALYQGPT